MASDNEYLTSNRRTRYPFADDSVIAKADGSQVGDSLALSVFGCLVDAFVSPKSATGFLDVSPAVTNLSVAGTALRFDLVNTASTEFEAANVVVARTPERFIVVNGECAWCYYSFVVSTDGIRDFSHDAAAIGDITSCVIRIADRCVCQVPANVTELWVYGGEKVHEDGDRAGKRLTLYEALEDFPDKVVTGSVKFLPGYNMTFGDGTGFGSIVSDQRVNGFSLNAVPGAGDGHAPCGCEPVDVAFNTPGILSRDGHTRLFNDKCYDLVPTVYSEKYGVLKMHAKCKACCTCEMYADLVNNRLIPLRDRITAAESSLRGTFDKYEENVAKWNERLVTAMPEDVVVSYSHVALDAAGTDLKAGANVSGKMSRCGFSVVMRNESFVEVDAYLDMFRSSGDVFESQVGHMAADGTPVVTPLALLSGYEGHDKLVTLPPGRSATLVFYVRSSAMVTTDKQTGFLASIALSFQQGDRLVVSKSRTLSV